MIEFEHTEVVGWEAAIRGMRNPHNSWDKSDSEYLRQEDGHIIASRYEVGSNDHDLMMRLVKAGTDHRKFMRMIVVYVDVTAPLYWYKELETYKVGTVSNSCSTMHSIHKKPFFVGDFSCEDILDSCDRPIISARWQERVDWSPYEVFCTIVELLNRCREMYLETGEKIWWRQIIQFLPSNYNQRRTLMLNYEVLANIYRARRNHKLTEWREFCRWIETLPYSELITGGVE
mgnify:FL=1|jgi:hypothetical protein